MTNFNKPHITIENEDYFFFRGEVYSSKNSKRIVRRGTGSLIIASAAVTRYIKQRGKQYSCKESIAKFREICIDKKPIHVGFYFIRTTKRLFDYNNMTQLIADLLVEYGWIDDDNCNEFVIYPLGYYVLDKKEKNEDNAGVVLKLLDNEYTDIIPIGHVKNKCFVYS